VINEDAGLVAWADPALDLTSVVVEALPSARSCPTLLLHHRAYARMRPMSIAVRRVTPADAAGICAVMNPIIEARAYTVFDRPFTVEGEHDYIARFPARGIWNVAVRDVDGRLVGFQVFEPFATYTGALDHVATIGTFVDLSLRRHGIARALFAETLKMARAAGYEKVVAWVRADNPAALATY
jgi:L-amino acid N-acyltransferase YncA